ncbi:MULTISPECIES: translocation/assembly module TamB domain-containing protein [unclassified Rhizobium]|uniref:translocation/assembly module TamB domain-containing protein n=1 Tax=unclassified Rhizobium TaxID=2613769 RepID=UPI00178F7FB8|nr:MULTISPECIES: translocation/assembly module TamB domain-containing protein [unclassified Rhizobium]MBB3542660.1 translocation and assembly module TamB [Rhizobium sp. BK399]MCS3739459.1 translocation and assembly module TamB [Rhizobium sp. BK661]MCS4091334.1 translocation and assembly module TamB [Rhizobium sp. BK176]
MSAPMQTLAKILNWIVRLLGYSVGTLLILLAIAIGVFGFTSFGARIITDRVASSISNRDMTIKVQEPEGLLTGGLRASQIVLSDTKGVFAQVDGLAISWNPLALLTGRFHARSIEATAIHVLRQPVRTLPSRPAATGEADTGFSLPVKIDIDKIALPEINLAQPLIGRAFSLAADGSMRADNDGGNASINVHRHDAPDAKLIADAAFLPDRNQLRLKAKLTEPKGGLLAGLLGLPGNPAVEIGLTGDGPLSDWRGQLQAALDGQQRASIEAHHTLTPENLHHLDLKGGGDLSSLLPAAFRPLFAGQTNIDVAANFDNRGKIDIQTGNLATGAVVIAASGTLDPKGNNSLNANLLGTSGPVDFRWPLADGEARLLVAGINLSLTGDAKASRLNASASLDSAALPQATMGNVKLTAKSDNFNLAGRTGSVQITLAAGDTSFVNPDIDRAIKGPVTITLPLQISPDALGFNGATIESAAANANLNGSYKLSASAITGNIKLTAQPAVLPPAVATRFNAPIVIEGQVAGTIPSKFNISNLSIKSNALEATGQVVLDEENLDANLSGRIPNVQALLETASGELNYQLSAKGNVSALAVAANIKGPSLVMAGRQVKQLELNLSGTADPNAPKAQITARGAIDNQPINVATAVQIVHGKVQLPSIAGDVGKNRLTGHLELSPAFEPTGQATFDFPDIGLLAALGGQKAEGDLKGSVDIANDSGKIALKVVASGSGLKRDTFAIVGPDINVAVTDLKAFAATGTITAQELASGPNKAESLALNFTQQQNRTNFDLGATYDANPLVASGSVEVNAGTTLLRLDRFLAKPRNIQVELASPSEVSISGSTVTLSAVELKTGDGSVHVSGTVGETLDIKADIRNLPASLANSFVPKLDAAGTISGKVAVTGTPAAPIANFDLDWKDAATSQTKGAGLSPLAIDASGTFANNTLDFETNANGKGGVSLKAAGSVVTGGPDAQSLKVDADIINIPAGLANAFVPDLAAEGSISGNVTAAGKLPAPTLDFKLNWKNAATSQTRSAKLSSLGLTASGNLKDNILNFDADARGSGGMSLQASGNFVVAGAEAQTLKLDGQIANIPAALANGFVPNLAAEGMISGTISATGKLPKPAATFDLTWKDAATSHTRAARLSGMRLAAKGNFADEKLNVQVDLTANGGMALNASGNVSLAGTTIENLTADATIRNVPASLANAFVSGLGASGTVSGTASASGTLQRPTASFDLTWKDLATAQTKAARLSSLVLGAKGTFANNVLDFQTNLTGDAGSALSANGKVTLEGTTVKSLQADATLSNLPAALVNNFAPDLGAEGTISGTATASGSLPIPAVDFKLNWNNAGTRQTRAAGLSGLTLNASGNVADNKIAFDATLTSSRSSLLRAKGTANLQGASVQGLSVDADIANLPASLANGFVPGLGAEGTISGTAKTSGTPSNPIIDFNLDWKDAATTQTRASGIRPLSVNAGGKLANGRLDFTTNLSGTGVSMKAGGNFIIAGQNAQSLTVNADISNLPAGLANAFVPGLAAEGNISGTVRASGRLPVPAVDFNLDWRGAATSQTRSAGLSPLSIAANGRLQDNRLTIDTNVAGDSGLSLRGGGSVTITGNRALDMRFSGSLPFAVLGSQLAAQGFVADGTANLNLQIAGTAAAPSINGTVATSGARFVDVRRNLAINNLAADIRFNGNEAVISRLTGQLASGGSISVSGSVGIQPASNFPANIDVRLDRAVYVDGTLVVATVDGTIGLRGPLLANPTLNGRLRLERASITVPERLPTSLREIDIRHINAPKSVLAQLRDETQQGARAKSNTINLDLQLDAPSQIFVRGRGIDAELGGSVTIRGTAAAPIVSGGFTMRRGRMTILNRRLDFTNRSRISFAGDLTPALDMEASSTSGSTTLTVNVAGLATDPSITFSSSPALPQDEVLAQLIFGQSMSRLSPVQIAQLADAVSQLAGGRSGSLFQGLRNQLGVDDFDVSTDAKGRTSVSVGRYLNDRTYFELQQTTGKGGAKAIINFDVGRGVKLRAGAGGDGEGEAGVVYEHEY